MPTPMKTVTSKTHGIRYLHDKDGNKRLQVLVEKTEYTPSQPATRTVEWEDVPEVYEPQETTR